VIPHIRGSFDSFEGFITQRKIKSSGSYFYIFLLVFSHYFLLRLKKIFFGSNLSNIAPLVNFGRDFRHKDVLDNPVS